MAHPKRSLARHVCLQGAAGSRDIEAFTGAMNANANWRRAGVIVGSVASALLCDVCASDIFWRVSAGAKLIMSVVRSWHGQGHG
eukprot:1494410-Alexandrium_andersonii.AAC.1